nr:B-cell receptor CD22-like [Crassostrea gigas]
MNQQYTKEGTNLSVTCLATPGNPSYTIFYWTKIDNQGFTQNGTTLQLPNIQRTSSGTYRCTAENIYRNGEKGSDSQSMTINVLYPPTVIALSRQYIIEGRNLSINCQATPGNPSSTTFYWTNNQGFRQNGATLQLYIIQKTNSGTYRCTAENNYGDGEKGTNSLSMVVDVQYPPFVNLLSKQNILEGRNLSVTCQAIPGNPRFTTFYWTKADRFRRNGATLQLPDIQRNSSGTYICTAENSYNNGKKGTHSQPMVVNVLYQPRVESKPFKLVNDSEEVILTRNIYSNPLSNVSWFNSTELLKTDTSVITASFSIKRATCADTKNYTLVATNGVGNTVSAFVGLIVNCKPMSDKTNITLGVTWATGIEFSSTIIAYPEPLYELQYENGTTTTQIMSYITRNAVNNFTVCFRQREIDQSSFGLYYLRMSNIFGESTVIVHVIEQSK